MFTTTGNPWPSLPDACEPTTEQRRTMGVLASTVLVDIRALLHNGNTAKAKELADAFHNAPALVWTNAFSPTMLHRQLEQLHASGPTLTSGELLKELRQAFPEQLSPKRDSSGDRTEG